MVVVGEVGKSAVCRRYNNSPRTLPWGTPALIGDRGWCEEATLTKEMPVMQIGLEKLEIIEGE
jgi:hypothetical protein